MFTKKTIIAFILTICLVIATPVSVLSSVGDNAQQIEQAGSDLIDSSGSDNLEIVDNINETDETSNSTNEPNGNSTEPSGGTDGTTDGIDEPNSGTDEPNESGETDEPSDGSGELDDNTDESSEEPDELTDEEPPCLNISVDEERNVTAFDTEGLEYMVEYDYYTVIDELALAVIDEYGEGSFDILLQSDSFEIDIYDVELTVDVPPDWAYEIWFDEGATDDDETELSDDTVIITVTPSPQLTLAAPREDEPIVVETQSELLRVFTHGAATGGDSNWSGERIVETAFNHFTDTINLAYSGVKRTVILRSAYDTQHDITIGSGGRHFNVANNFTLVIDDENLHFVGNDLANATGGGIRVSDGGTLILQSGTIRNCRADDGGGVDINGSNALFEMHGGVIEKNHASFGGGGVLVDQASTFYMYDGIIRGNRVTNASAQSCGGGVRVRHNSLFNMQGGTIEENEILHTGQYPYGGGVGVGEAGQNVNTSTFNMNGGKIINNKAQWGGGVAAFNGYFNLGTGKTDNGAASAIQAGSANAPIISGNEARGHGYAYTDSHVGHGGGGGVWAYDASGTTYPFIMHSGVIENNNTPYRGGGVFINRANFAILGGEIINNRTTDNNNINSGGGGVYLHTNIASVNHTPSLTVNNAAISGNSSRIGGGIARNSNSHITISENSVISANTAQLDGGGIHAGTPGSGANITSATVGAGRNNLNIASTVKFEGNRSNQPVSRSLTVDQTRINGDVFARVEWSGKNSANGSLDKANSYHLFNNHDINNLQGDIVRVFATLTVSNTIGGDLGNMLKEFEYAITFTGSDGKPLPSGTQIAYIGDIIPGLGQTAPIAGSLTLDNNGSATFTLGHGQALVFQEIPIGDYVQVVETSEDYDASFVDSEDENNVNVGNDTSLLEMSGNRLLNFYNERDLVSPPTGIASDNAGKIMLFVAVVYLIGAITLAINVICRKQSRKY